MRSNLENYRNRIRFKEINTASFQFCHNILRYVYYIYIQSMTSNCYTFLLKKLQKSVTIWEHLPKRYYLWTIIK